MKQQSARTWALVLIGLAVILRVALAIWLGDAAAPVSGAFDQVSYDTLAQRVLAGHGFSFPTGWYPYAQANEPTAHWSYLYTLYLAGVYAVFGHHPLAARVIEALLSGLNIWMAFRIGRRLFGAWVGVAAAAATTLYGYLLFFNAVLMTQTFYIIAVLAALDAALGLVERPTWRGWVFLGGALGVGALFRQTLLLFAPILLLWIGWSLWGKRRGGGAVDAEAIPAGASGVQGLLSNPVLRGIALAASIMALCVLPWTIYNYVTFHDFLLLNSNGGYWFYASNHPLQGTDFDGTLAPPIPVELRGLPEPAVDRALLKIGLGYIVEDPARFLRLSASRIPAQFWLLPSEESALVSNVARLFSFTLYLPFFLLGIWVARRSWRNCLPLFLYVGFDNILCLSSWSGARYRLPSDAVMMTFAGVALVYLVARARSLHPVEAIKIRA